MQTPGKPEIFEVRSRDRSPGKRENVLTCGMVRVGGATLSAEARLRSHNTLDRGNNIPDF